MAEDNENKSVNGVDKDILDEALKDFDSKGGFSGKPKSPQPAPQPVPESTSKPTPVSPTPVSPQPVSKSPSQPASSKKLIIEEEFPHFDDDDDDEPAPAKVKQESGQSSGEKKQSNLPSKTQANANIVDDFDDFDDDEEDIIAQPTQTKGGGNGGGNDGDDKKAAIIKKLKEPKNMIMIGIAFLFLLFLFFSGSGKKRQNTKNTPEQNADVQTSVEAEIEVSKKDEKIEQNPENVITSQMPNISLDNIELPNLDIKIPEIKTPNVNLVPNIPQPKEKEEPPKIPELKPDIINISNIEPPKITNPPIVEDDLEDIDIDKEVTTKKREIIKDKESLKPIVTDFTGGTKITKDKKKNNSKDFIFVDTDIDVESEANVINATKIEDPENVVAQGRIIDAALETAINSAIGGQIRAIVTRDVYAETGRNVLIPKGTRLYGEYGGANGKQSADRIVITWTRIMRPDNISANINSFAADQFGRSGIQGHTDNKYFSNITTSVLLSTIPLVTTIAVNAITNARQNTVTTTGVGGATVVQDPINIATQAFTSQISDATSKIIKNMGDTTPTITLEQGTRVKVLVNQDIKLPVYKSITKTSSGVTS
jgi:type IV secretion system protein VirB10